MSSTLYIISQKNCAANIRRHSIFSRDDVGIVPYKEE